LDITVISPNGVEVVSQSSNTVRVFVDEFTQKNDLLTVEIDTGDKGYRLGEGVSRINFSASPAVVTVSGPKSVLDSVARAVIKFPLDGNEIKEDIRGYGAITLLDNEGRQINNQYLSLSDSTAEVALTVIKEKVLPIRVNLVGGALIEGIAVDTPNPGAITVSGSSSAISALGSELVITIDETTLLPGKTHAIEIPIVEMLPKNISTENSGNITVNITVPKLSVREYSISADRIVIENLPENYICNIEKGIKVKVAGPLKAFDGFDSGTITAKIDFNNVLGFTKK
jgi:YbbR domain-containing protein